MTAAPIHPGLDEFIQGDIDVVTPIDEHRRVKNYSHGGAYNNGSTSNNVDTNKCEPRMLYEGKQVISPQERLQRYAESLIIESNSVVARNIPGSSERNLACLDRKLAEGILGKEFDSYDAVAQNLHPEVLREIDNQRSRNYWIRVQSVFESAAGIYKGKEAAERFKEWAGKIRQEGSLEAQKLADSIKERANRMIYTESVIDELKDSRQSGLTFINGYREIVKDLSTKTDDSSRMDLGKRSAQIYEIINLMEQRGQTQYVDKKVMSSFRDLAEYTAEKSNRRSFPERYETALGQAIKTVSNKVSNVFGSLFRRK